VDEEMPQNRAEHEIARPIRKRGVNLKPASLLFSALPRPNDQFGALKSRKVKAF